MTPRERVYLKFGCASECGQLLETELGTLLLEHNAVEKGWLDEPDPEDAARLLHRVNRSTLGRLIGECTSESARVASVAADLDVALRARNRLAHHFFREHNFRLSTPEGCEVMLADLESLHDQMLHAYKELMRLSGFDLDQMAAEAGNGGVAMPTKHRPI